MAHIHLEVPDSRESCAGCEKYTVTGPEGNPAPSAREKRLATLLNQVLLHCGEAGLSTPLAHAITRALEE